MPTLWPHVPTSISEVMEFLTDVQAVQNGEFRTTFKDATQRLNFGHHFLDAEAARADGLYRSQPTGEWYVPLWADATRFVGAISASDEVISVQTDADYRAGGKAVILQDDQTYELVDVVSASGGLLYIESPGVVGNYVGTVGRPITVAPVLTAIAPAGLDRADRVNLAQSSIAFIVTDPADLAASIYPSHRNFDVVTDALEASQPLRGRHSQEIDLIDTGFGAYAMETEEDYVRAQGTFSVVKTAQSDRHALRTWLHRARGRDMAFWLPSWKADLPLTATIGAAATTFVTQKVSPVVADHVGRSIQFLLPSGSIIHREITGAVEASATTVTLTIAAPGVAVSPLSVVSLMHLVRFDTDAIEVRHQVSADGYVSTISAPVIEVPA